MHSRKKLLSILILLLITITTHSCWFDWLSGDTDEKLPPITQSGEGTFGCLVDGEVWIPKGRILYNSEYNIEYESYLGVEYIDIYASYEGSSGFRFSICKDSMRLGKNTIKREIGRGSGIRYQLKGNANYFTQESVGELIVTNLDTITNDINVTPYRINSGTFWFDLYNEDGEIIEIRNGRFDLRDYNN